MFVTAIVGLAGASDVRASGDLPGPLGTSDKLVVVVGTFALVAPSEIGTLIHDRRADFVLGWSWQVPITRSFHHRLVGGLNWAPWTPDHHFGQRLGYRFGARDFLIGMGVAHDNSNTTLSPEVGLKFVHGSGRDPQLDVSLHILVRIDVAPALGAFRTATVFLGWNLF
jgi:hypothetical protein